MKISVVLSIIFYFFLCGCSNDDTSNIEEEKTDSLLLIRKTNNDDEKIRVETATVEQIGQLEKIIAQKKQRLEEYQLKVIKGDTIEISGLPEYIKDLENAILIKEKRLAQLKKN